MQRTSREEGVETTLYLGVPLPVAPLPTCIVTRRETIGLTLGLYSLLATVFAPNASLSTVSARARNLRFGETWKNGNASRLRKNFARWINSRICSCLKR